MFGFLNPASRNAGAGRIDPKDAVARAASGELTVIDVRDISELKSSGKAKGALHVPLMMLATRCDPNSPECLSALSVEKPVALYCASGTRSQMAAGMLARMGYAQVYNLGGLHDWHAAGGQIERA